MSGPLGAALEVCARRLDPGARAPLAVAFSGGGDSLALLLAARTYARDSGRALAALHVDHGLQTQSAAWAVQAQDQAETLGVPCHLLRWDGVKPATGLPAAARAARHRLIADAARALGAKAVLLGHTLDDQLENAVMRGAGAPVGALQEWSASPAWPQGRGLFHCRPLLAVRRADLRTWLAAQGLTWFDDPANDDPRYARARARRAVGQGAAGEPIPTADIRALASACRATPWGGFEIDRPRLLAAQPAQALRLLQIAVACASGAEALARPARARTLLERLRAGERFTAGLGGARVEAGDAVLLCREPGEAARGGLAPIRLEPGRAAVWDGRFEIAVDRPGLAVEALRGQAAGLDAADAARLRGIPACARASMPVIRGLNTVSQPLHLALEVKGAHIEAAGVRPRALAEERFAGAAGLVSKEAEIGTIADMAKFPPPTYVMAETRANE